LQRDLSTDALADSTESARQEAAMLKCLDGDWVL
jgi:hypothetical protein